MSAFTTTENVFATISQPSESAFKQAFALLGIDFTGLDPRSVAQDLPSTCLRMIDSFCSTFLRSTPSSPSVDMIVETTPPKLVYTAPTPPAAPAPTPATTCSDVVVWRPTAPLPKRRVVLAKSNFPPPSSKKVGPRRRPKANLPTRTEVKNKAMFEDPESLLHGPRETGKRFYATHSFEVHKLIEVYGNIVAGAYRYEAKVVSHPVGDVNGTELVARGLNVAGSDAGPDVFLPVEHLGLMTEIRRLRAADSSEPASTYATGSCRDDATILVTPLIPATSAFGADSELSPRERGIDDFNDVLLDLESGHETFRGNFSMNSDGSDRPAFSEHLMGKISARGSSYNASEQLWGGTKRAIIIYRGPAKSSRNPRSLPRIANPLLRKQAELLGPAFASRALPSSAPRLTSKRGREEDADHPPRTKRRVTAFHGVPVEAPSIPEASVSTVVPVSSTRPSKRSADDLANEYFDAAVAGMSGGSKRRRRSDNAGPVDVSSGPDEKWRVKTTHFMDGSEPVTTYTGPVPAKERYKRKRLDAGLSSSSIDRCAARRKISHPEDDVE